MISTTETIRERFPMIAHCGVSVDDGFGTLHAMSMLIMVESERVPLDVTLDQSRLIARDLHSEWVAEYVHGRDLRRVFDFAPTPSNCVAYFYRVFTGVDPLVRAVSVSFDGESVFTVERD